MIDSLMQPAARDALQKFEAYLHPSDARLHGGDAPALQLGTLIIAPEGFESLQKDRWYYFLVNTGQMVRLAELVEGRLRKVGKKRRKLERLPPSVNLIDFPSNVFEAVLGHDVLFGKAKFHRPQWQQDKGNRDIEHKSGRGASMNAAHSKRIDRKLEQLAPFTSDIQAQLARPDLMEALKSAARTARPAPNEARFVAWFFLYAVFGRAGLAYQTNYLGQWSRVNHTGAIAGVKPHGVGKRERTTTYHKRWAAATKEGWATFAAPGRPVRTVYRLTCVHILNCRVAKDAKGRKRFVMPNGGAAYTYDQFHYLLVRDEGLDKIRLVIHGRAKYREDFAPSRGKFSQAVAAIGEIIQEDVKRIPERAFGPDGQVLPQLLVAREVDVTSSMCLGLGFGFEPETGAAYRMAKFCQEVPKDFFGALFGLTFDRQRWPSQGSTEHTVRDKGPGMSKTARPNPGHAPAALQETPPTGFGQGNANVESTHTRRLKVHDRPAYVTTRIPLIFLIQRAIREELARMDSGCAEGHLSPTLAFRGDLGTPLEIYNALAPNGRTWERRGSIDAAVRKWLTPIDLAVGSDGAYLGTQRYDSNALRASGVLAVGSKRRDGPTLRGYSLDMCRRYLWVDANGRLIMVAWMDANREPDAQLFMSALEQNALERHLAENRSYRRQHRDASAGEQEIEFVNDTGLSMDDRQRRPGRIPNRTQAAKEEARKARALLTTR